MRSSVSPGGVSQVLGSDEAWYRFVMDRLPLGVITVDHDRRVTYINTQAQKLTGWSAEQAVGRSCKQVLRGGQCQAQCPLQTVLAHGSDTVDLRSTLTNRSGEIIPIRFRTVALHDEDQKLVGAVEAFFDIRQTLALEEERARTLSYFAHDMKSPLVGAIGFLERLLAGKAGELAGKQREYLDIVRFQLMHVQELVADYLDVIRLGSDQARLNLEQLDIAEVLQGLAQTYGRRAQDKGLGWNLVLDDGLPPLLADRIRLSRALANLIDNAVKFTAQGQVEIKCDLVCEQRLRILICDQGPGLTPDDQQKIFSPFFRGSAGRQVEGTGLGLAAVKSIIEAHGGEVFASNREQGGACFAAILPSSRPQEASAPA